MAEGGAKWLSLQDWQGSSSAHFSIISSSLEQFFLCVNQTALCIIDTDTHWHADSGIMMTQESIWPVIFCISRRKQCPECSRNKRSGPSASSYRNGLLSAVVPTCSGTLYFKKAPVRLSGSRANLSQKDNKGCVKQSANFMTCKSLHTPVIGQNTHTDHVLIFNQNGNYHCYSE